MKVQRNCRTGHDALAGSVSARPSGRRPARRRNNRRGRSIYSATTTLVRWARTAGILVRSRHETARRPIRRETTFSISLFRSRLFDRNKRPSARQMTG